VSDQVVSEQVLSEQRVISKVLSSGNGSSRAVLLVLSLALLALLSACGYGNNNYTIKGVKCPGSTGSFNNATLGPSGTQWVYSLSGQLFATVSGVPQPFVEGGFFTVDGNGGITGGNDDLIGPILNNGSTYTITNNGTGTINLNFGGGLGTISFAVSVTATSPAALYMIDADNQGFANSAGVAYQQNNVPATPNGTFVFRTHVTSQGITIAGSTATVGVMSVSNGTITGLNDDGLQGGSVAGATKGTLNIAQPHAFTSTGTGVGTVAFTDTNGISGNFNYYMVDANTILLDDGISGVGRMEMQSSTTLAVNSGFAFGSHGDSNGTVSALGPGSGGINAVGAFTVDASGAVTGGSLDFVQDGTTGTGISITGGSYVADATGDGRYTITLNGSNATTILTSLYTVSAARGFFLVNDLTGTTVQDGTADQQTSTSNLSGQFAFVMGGTELVVPTPNFLDRTGTITADGNGNLGWAEVANSNGVPNAPGCQAGTYAFTSGSNGRFIGNVGGAIQADLVFYAIAPGKAYILQPDSNVQISGGMSQQGAGVVDPPGVFAEKVHSH